MIKFNTKGISAIVGGMAALVAISYIGITTSTSLQLRHEATSKMETGNNSGQVLGLLNLNQYSCGANYYPQDKFQHIFDRWDRNEVAADLDRIKALNGNLVRTFIPKDGSYVSQVGEFLDLAQEKGVGVVMSLMDVSNFPCDYYGVGNMTQYLDAYGNHPAIVAWDLKNEPACKDSGGDFTIFTEHELNNLKKFANEIVRPRTNQPLTVGLKKIHVEWVPRVLEFTDIAQVHDYWDINSTLSTAQRLVQLSPGKPRMMGEFGIPSNGDPSVNESIQRSYYEQVLPALKNMGINYILPWASNDFSTMSGFEKYWGVMDTGGRVKPAGDYFKSFCAGGVELVSPGGSGSTGSGTCDAWQEANAPITAGINPEPGFAIGDYYYLAKRSGGNNGYLVAKQKSDGTLENFIDKPNMPGSDVHAFAISIANGSAWLFKNCHYLKIAQQTDGTIQSSHDYGGSNDGGNTCKKTPNCSGNPNDGAFTNETATVSAHFSSGKDIVFQLGAYEQSTGASPDKGWFNDTRSAVVPGNFSCQGHSPAEDGGMTIEAVVGNADKAAFVQGADSNHGFIFLKVHSRDNVYMAPVNDSGHIGSWSNAGSLPNGWGHGEFFGYEGYLYDISGTNFARAQVNSGTGALGAWESLPDLPGTTVKIGSQPVDLRPSAPTYGIINGKLYVFVANGPNGKQVYFYALDGSCSGSGGSGGGVKPGVGENISCTTKEWLVTAPNVITDPIECPNAKIGKPNADYCDGQPEPCEVPTDPVFSCEAGAKCYSSPHPIWVKKSPTNTDFGQKDGTGYVGEKREYRYFDYQNNIYLDIPPFWFGTGGGASVMPDSTSGSPIYNGSNTSPEIVPCGWPSNSSYRKATQSCFKVALHDPNTTSPSDLCPDDMSSASTCTLYKHPASTNAIDIGGEFHVYATMTGKAYRCVDMPYNQADCGCSDSQYKNEKDCVDNNEKWTRCSYGVFVKVVNDQYTTMNAHLVSDPYIDTATPISDPDGVCGLYGKLVKNWDVTRGDPIGMSDNTGHSKGSHLHYEVRYKKWDTVNKVTYWERLCPASFMDRTNDACQSGGDSVTFSAHSGLGALLHAINPFATDKQDGIDKQAEYNYDSVDDYE